MKPYYEHGGITIYHGDCREILTTLEKPDVLVTDPPYGVNCEVSTAGCRILGDENTKYRDWVVEHFNGLPMIIFGSPKVRRPKPDHAVIIWDKGELTGMGDLDFPWKLTHEEIYIIGKGFKTDRRLGSVIKFVSRPNWTNHPNALTGLHPTEKPLGLMIYLLERCPDGTVIDPFMGSGTTLRAAKDLGSKAIGIELEEKYCEIAAIRLEQEVLI